MSKYQIVQDNYLYEVNPLQANGLHHATLAFYAHFAKAFEDAGKAWEQKVKDEAIQYADDLWPLSMVLSVEGIPCALVTNVDDFVQVYPIEQTARIEESK